jgi:hypothetical protein
MTNELDRIEILKGMRDMAEMTHNPVFVSGSLMDYSDGDALIVEQQVSNRLAEPPRRRSLR